MKTIYTCLIIMFFTMLVTNLYGQTNLIKGSVSDINDIPLAFANVSVVGTIDGTSSEDDGTFVLETSASGAAVLKVTLLGYEDYSTEIEVPQSEKFIIKLRSNAKVLSEVVVSASSFQLKGGVQGDVKNAVELVTVAGSDGDLYRAMADYQSLFQWTCVPRPQ